MADISITQAHKLTPDRARAAAQEVADRLGEKYAVRSEWNGNILSFQGFGVSGSLALHQDEARLEIALGALLKGFAPQIEEKAARNMRTIFSAA